MNSNASFIQTCPGGGGVAADTELEDDRGRGSGATEGRCAGVSVELQHRWRNDYGGSAAPRSAHTWIHLLFVVEAALQAVSGRVEVRRPYRGSWCTW